MRDSSRRALFAAAKLALGAAASTALSGCGGAMTTDDRASAEQAGSAAERDGSGDGTQAAVLVVRVEPEASAAEVAAAEAAPQMEPPRLEIDAQAKTETDVQPEKLPTSDASVSISKDVAPKDAGTDAHEGTDARSVADVNELVCISKVELLTPPERQLLSDDELACCLTETAARIATARETAADSISEVLSQDPDVVNCCTALINRDAFPSQLEEQGVREVCCFQGILPVPQETLYSRSYCTPWGPPVPPAMPGAEGRTHVA